MGFLKGYFFVLCYCKVTKKIRLLQLFSVKCDTPVLQDSCIYLTISDFYVKFLADSDI